MGVCTNCKFIKSCGDDRVVTCAGFELNNIYEGFDDFLQDECKMHDFITMSMEDFLNFYSYLDEQDYYATYDALMNLIGENLGWQYTIELPCSRRPSPAS